MEEFRSLSYIDGYQISNLGRVRNTKTNKILVQYISKDKYNKVRSCSICVSNNNKKKTYFIHRLVADAFIENPENKPFVDHIDRDPTNNNITNLRWATPLENAQNTSKGRNNTTGETNIYYCKNTKNYKIMIKRDYKYYYFGHYDTFEEAKKAKETGDYKKRVTNINEKYVRFNTDRNKYEFRKQKGDNKHIKFFLTLQEALEYRDTYLSNSHNLLL
jgi:hypothetical protein